jgi:6-phosphogluconolactonase
LQKSIFKTFSMRWTFLLIAFLLSTSCFSQDPYLFIGTYTSGKSVGIYVYQFNIASGTGKEISSMKCSNPSYLCLSPDGKHLYATEESNGNGSVGAYAFDPPTGRLAWLNAQPSHGAGTCYVTEDKTSKWVFLANYSSGSIACLPVNTDGSLAPATQVIQQTGSSKNKDRQEASHAHSVIFSPDERYLLEANLGTDQEHVYKFNPAQNAPLSEEADSAVSLEPGTGPRHIVFHPNKPFVYIIGELTGTVDAFHYDSSNGRLTHLQRIRTTPEKFMGDPGSADIHIRGDGKFLYASNRGNSNTIAVFSILDDGKLIAKQYISVNGKHPRNFVIDPSNRFLLVANKDSDNIVIFSIDPSAGTLRATGNEISIPNPVCLKFFNP